MVSNGTGPNTDDTNTHKDMSARTEIKPFSWLSTGVFCLAKNGKFSDLNRYGANIKLNWDRYFIRTEYSGANDDDHKRPTGVYTDFAYKFNPKWQAVVRYENLTPDHRESHHAESYTLGANYFIYEHKIKLQGAYSELHNMDAANGSTSYKQDREGHLFVLSTQVNF